MQIIAVPSREESTHTQSKLWCTELFYCTILHFCFTWHTFIKQIQNKCFKGTIESQVLIKFFQMHRHLTASVLFCLNDARRRNNHCMCPSNRVELLVVGGLKKEVQIKKSLNQLPLFTYLLGVDILRGKK